MFADKAVHPFQIGRKQNKCVQEDSCTESCSSKAIKHCGACCKSRPAYRKRSMATSCSHGKPSAMERASASEKMLPIFGTEIHPEAVRKMRMYLLRNILVREMLRKASVCALYAKRVMVRDSASNHFRVKSNCNTNTFFRNVRKR